MSIFRLLNKNKDREPKTYEKVYDLLVEKKIREKYSISDELAFLRQKDAKPYEFMIYNEYVEQCKLEVKSLLKDDNNVV
jgi:hypothetical protein